MKHSNTLIIISWALLIFTAIFFSPVRSSNLIAKVNYDVSGCFSSGKSKLTIYKLNDSIIAELESHGKNTIKAKLNSLQMSAFNKFIDNLKNLNQERGCTTTSHYIASYKGEIIRKTDGGCKWNGFYNLQNVLFGHQQ